jgi:23S rRNA pseudouridine2604 synthase
MDLKDLNLLMPLGTDTCGLIVFTQEYGIARKLTDDSAKIEQEYVVEVVGELSASGLKQLNHGLSWRGAPVAPMKVSWQSDTRLRFALKNPQPGLIADMCRQVGLTVVSIKRIRIGRLPMAGLPSGQWRYLLGYERF